MHMIFDDNILLHSHLLLLELTTIMRRISSPIPSENDCV